MEKGKEEETKEEAKVKHIGRLHMYWFSRENTLAYA
jgi:hypothetical protein